MAGRRSRAWDSALSVDEFAAVRSVGFEPVGQVFGAAVYYLATVLGVGCPGTTAASYERRDAAAVGSGRGRRRFGRSARAEPACGARTALDRMAGECAELGGHGVIGAALRVTEIPGTSLTAAAVEFTVIGTAVRVNGCAPLARPFATELSGADFAKLVMGGWVPAGIALGIAVAGLHDELATTSSGPWGTGNAEMPGLHGSGQRRAQRCTRPTGAVSAIAGADGVVVSALTLRVQQRPVPCPRGRYRSFRRGGHRRQRRGQNRRGERPADRRRGVASLRSNQ